MYSEHRKRTLGKSRHGRRCGPRGRLGLSPAARALPVGATVLPAMRAETFPRICRCIVNKQPNVKEKAQLHPMSAQSPFEMISIDFISSLLGIHHPYQLFEKISTIMWTGAGFWMVLNRKSRVIYGFYSCRGIIV